MITPPGGAKPTKVDFDEFESRKPRIKTTEEKSYSERYKEHLRESTGAKYNFKTEPNVEKPPAAASQSTVDNLVMKSMFGIILLVFVIVTINTIYKRHKRKQGETREKIQKGELEANFFNEFVSSDVGRNLFTALEGLAFLAILYLGFSLVVGIYNKANEMK